MLKPTSPDTRQQILDAAYELFSEHGFDHVSTRLIAEKAGVALGGIHYHFKNKEGLYVEVVRLATDGRGAVTIDTLLTENPRLLDTDEGKCEAIRHIVEDFFRRCFEGNNNRMKKLMFREMGQDSPSPLLDEALKPETERGMRFFKMLKPNATDEDAFLWSHLPTAQASYLTLGKTIVERMTGKDFSEQVRQRVVRLTIEIMIRMIDLPIPKDWND